ncbi:hypothetical protein M5K25_007812 [Dendrobium thyrsiflorum]|uniref:Uncharacterized protein n=1 Tax=Dendrobium thyrsiflorum TaxID=117978 RepID=A0ABD0VM79_DENTH
MVFLYRISEQGTITHLMAVKENNFNLPVPRDVSTTALINSTDTHFDLVSLSQEEYDCLPLQSQMTTSASHMVSFTTSNRWKMNPKMMEITMKRRKAKTVIVGKVAGGGGGGRWLMIIQRPGRICSSIDNDINMRKTIVGGLGWKWGKFGE